MAEVRRGLLESSSTIALLCVLVPAAAVLLPGRADAACDLGGSAAAAEVICADPYDASLIYDRTNARLLLEQDTGEEPETQRLDTDLEGNDAIRLGASAEGPASLSVSEQTSVGDFVNRQFALFLRGGNDTVTGAAGSRLIGAISGDDGDDVYDMNGISELIQPVPPSFADVSFAGGAGNDTITVGPEGIVGRLLGGEGDDVFDLSGAIGASTAEEGPVLPPVVAGSGDDTIDVRTSARVFGAVVGGAGADTIRYAGEFVDLGGDGIGIAGGAGNDTIDVLPGADVGAVRGGGGDDTITVEGTVSAPDPDNFSIAVGGDAGGDTINIRSGAAINNVVSGGGGNDTVTMTGGTIVGGTVIETAGVRIGFGITGDDGNDTVDVSGGSIAGFVFGGNGNDTINASGGTVGDQADRSSISALVGYAGNDEITVSGTTVVNGFVIGDGDFIFNPEIPGIDVFPVPPGRDTVRIEGGLVTGGVFTGGLDDTITVSGGQIGLPGITGDPLAAIDGIGTDRGALGEVRGNDGDDTITVTGGTIYGEVGGDDGGDRMTVTGGTLFSNLAGGLGNDRVAVGGGVIAGNVSGDEGDDTIGVSGGIVRGNVAAGAGNDAVRVSGGTIVGDVDGGDGALDRLDYTGGAIGEAIRNFETVAITSLAVPEPSELVPNPLPITIVGPADVTLADTTFAETNLSDFDLDGVTTFTADNSLFTFSGGLGIGDLVVTNGSILDIRGRTALRRGNADALGNLTIANAGVDFIDGATDDSLDVQNLTVNNATIGVDVDPLTGVADLIRVNGLFDATGGPAAARVITLQPQNTIIVNLLAQPAAGTDTLIPIILLPGDVAGDAVDPAFDVIALNASLLNGFQLINGPGGSIFLRAIPVDPNRVSDDPQVPGIVGAGQHNIGVVQDVLTDITDGGVGFATASERIQITPTFGVFSYGQFGQTFHDGLDFSSAFGGGTTSSFTSDNFSIIGTAELDASAEFGLEDIGLKISAFGGYTSTDVSLDDRGVFGRSTGDNDSGLFGASVLVSKIQGEGNLNYGLLSAAGVFGNTDVFAAETGGRGDYGTEGYILSAKVGRNMAVADRVRVDVRGGIAYAAFYGDSFTDSAGTNYGDTRLSYATVIFEPGVSTTTKVGEFLVSPFARGLLAARFGYENTSSVNDVDFDFDDNDFTIGGQLGANANLGKNFSAGALIEGRTSGDESAILGKLSLKYTIPR
jgi:hypothetical protein